MLSIKVTRPPEYCEQWIDWHVGETVPQNLGRVVEFQADGDELDMILDAMKPKSRGFSLEDPCGIIAATLIIHRTGTKIYLSQRALDLLELRGSMTGDSTRTNPLFWMPESSIAYGELAAPSND